MGVWHGDDGFWETAPMFDGHHGEIAPAQVAGA
jgi:hypothetical protein